MMKHYIPEELKEVLRLHAIWRNDAKSGSRAELRGADLSDAELRGADLSGADLSDANLIGADLRGAELRDANLIGADLSGAELRGADLSDANLRGADLIGADLSGADLRRANLRRADLRDANLIGAELRDANLIGADLRDSNLIGAELRDANLIGADLRGANLSGAKNAELALAIGLHIPPEGPFWAWKKCHSINGNILVKLLIPAEARRSHGSERKCRAEFVDVLEVIGADEGVSDRDRNVRYRAGERVVADSWDEDRWETCSHGIHFMLTKEEAMAYSL